MSSTPTNSSNLFWYCVERGSRSIHSSVWAACCVLVGWYWRTLVPLQLIRGWDADISRCLVVVVVRAEEIVKGWMRRIICSRFFCACGAVVLWCVEQSEWARWIRIHKNCKGISFISLQVMEDDGFAQSRLFLRKWCLLDKDKLDKIMIKDALTRTGCLVR